MIVEVPKTDAIAPVGNLIDLLTATAAATEEKSSVKLRAIVAAGLDNAIGRAGDMPWHLPEDLRHFKQLTLGKSVIMGRRTWESLPGGALPGRRNIVVSGTPGFVAAGAEVFSSLEDAIRAVAAEREAFIIGGGEIYRRSLPAVVEIDITRVQAEYPDADTFFPSLSGDEWHLAEQSEMMTSKRGLDFRFEKWVRK